MSKNSLKKKFIKESENEIFFRCMCKIIYILYMSLIITIEIQEKFFFYIIIIIITYSTDFSI